MSSLLFLDTETTGVELDADVWEVAAVKRGPRGREVSVHFYVQHDTRKCNRLPERFLMDHRERFPMSDTDRWAPGVLSREDAGRALAELLGDRPHLVGAVPDFDAWRLEPYLQAAGVEERWHYHLIDVENLAVGYLFGRYGANGTQRPNEAEGEAVQLPWDSNKLSAAVGVDPDRYPRHTAMGDVMWARAIFDAVTAGGDVG